MPTVAESVIWGVITLSIVVVLHEGGHFLAAKAFGLKVHEFMVGLPGPKVSFTWKGTKFGLTAVPLGGYVKIAGMSGEQTNTLLEPVLGLLTARGEHTTQQVDDYFANAGDDPVMALVTLEDWGAVHYDKKADRWTSVYSPADVERAGGVVGLFNQARDRTYGTLTSWQKVAVLSAGVAVNIALAFLVFVAVLAIWGTPVEQRFVGVASGYPAEKAGIEAGDIPIAVNGRPIDSFDELIELVSAVEVGDKVSLTVKRGDTELSRDIVTVESPESGRAMLGLERQFANVPVPIGEAVLMSGSFVTQTAKMVFSLLSPSQAGETLSQSSSVVGISVVAAQAAERSALDYASIVASLSLSLGMINVLPVPPLDGGKIALTLWEAISRRRVSPAISAAVSVVGIVALLALMAFTMYNDIARLVG